MERYLADNEDFKQHYTCNYSVDSVPLEKRQSIALSAFFLTVGVVEIVCF